MGIHVVAILIVTAQAALAPAERAVVAVVQQLADAQRNFDQPALERLLTTDYVEVSPVGDVDERAKVIGFYSADAKAKSPVVSSIAIDEPNVRIDGEHATVIVRQTTNIGPAGASRAVVMRVTAHLRRNGNTWQIASTHYTGIRPPARPQ
ncbi:MAG TPA: nuclear transport factor 2 family protein [Vicinamibacterales bacterium]|jgi:ketosteroid isomerase-like protein